METLIEELPAAGGRVVQAEDEIAALGMVLGASFGGVPVDDGDERPGPLADDRDARPLEHGGAAGA